MKEIIKPVFKLGDGGKYFTTQTSASLAVGVSQTCVSNWIKRTGATTNHRTYLCEDSWEDFKAYVAGIPKPFDFEEKAMEVHGGSYCYENAGYTRRKDPVTLRCHACDHTYTVIASVHLEGGGKCEKCERRRKTEETTADFKGRAILVHGADYGYSETVCTRFIDKVTIYCRACEDYFTTKASIHLGGSKCPSCSKRGKTKSNSQFIAEVEAKHPGKFDFSATDYINNKKPVTVICKVHEVTTTAWAKSLLGSSALVCKQCRGEFQTDTQTITTEEFIAQAQKHPHVGRYDYSSSVYVHSHTPLSIYCKDCKSSFMQTPTDHKQGAGCPKCARKGQSKLELELTTMLDSHGISYEINNREEISPYEIDIYIPNHNVGIEVNSFYTHSYKSPPRRHAYTNPKPLNYHQVKWSKAKGRGIRLIQVWDFLYDKSPERYKSMILGSLGVGTTKVYAGQCNRVELPRASALAWIADQSLFGVPRKIPNNSEYWGLIYAGELIMACSYNDTTCDRVATMQGYSVAGGVSKLLETAKAGMTYFTTNDSGSTAKELDGFTEVNYSDVRLYAMKQSYGKYYELSWVSKDRAKDMCDTWDNSEEIEDNLAANGYFIVADSGSTKLVKD